MPGIAHFVRNNKRVDSGYRVVCPNFGNSALTAIYEMIVLQLKNSFATLANGLSVLKLFQFLNGGMPEACYENLE